MRLLDWLFGNKKPKPVELLAAGNFTAIDVETANVNKASICQIGVVQFRSGQIEDTWETLVNPREFFDRKFVAIHGIDTEHVSTAPAFPDVYDDLRRRLTGIVVSYSPFDRFALHEAIQRCALPDLACSWLDVIRGGFRSSLREEADKLGIAFNHHDAKEDARAAGELLIHLIKTSGLSAKQLLSMMEYDLNTSIVSESALTAKAIGYKGISSTIEGDQNGPLFGEVIVFSGDLSVSRQEAAELAAKAGCKVDMNVTRKTTLLVVGTQDLRLLAGHNKSSKHRRAEELNQKGHSIRILGERDFWQIIEL